MTAAVINPASGSRRQTLIIEETVKGVTPAAGTWDILRNTGGAGLSQSIETTESAELSGEVLGVRDIIETQRSNALAYNTEFPMDGTGTPYYLLLESLLGDRWGNTAPLTIVNGNTDVSFTVQDEFTDVGVSQAANGCLCTQMELTIQNNSIVTATWAGLGTSFLRPATVDIQAGSIAGVDDVIFTQATSTMTVSAGVPVSVVADSYVLVSSATTGDNNGYYKVLSVAGNDVVLDGVLTDDPSDTTALLQFSGDALSTGGTINPAGTVTSAKAGDFIQVDIDGSDTLDFGLRFTSATISIERVAEQLYEITLDDPFTTVSTDFTVTIAFEWHLINDYLLQLLDIQSEHSLAIVVEDSTGNSLRFEFDRTKFSEGAFGEAARGQSMTGTATATALLPVSNEMVRIIASS